MVWPAWMTWLPAFREFLVSRMLGIFRKRKLPIFKEAELADALGKWDGRQDFPTLSAHLSSFYEPVKSDALAERIHNLADKMISTAPDTDGQIDKAAKNAETYFAERHPSLQPGAVKMLGAKWALLNK